MKADIIYSGSACQTTVNIQNRTVLKTAYRFNQGIENGHDKLWNEANYIKQQNVFNDFYPHVKSIQYLDDDLVVEYEFLFQGLNLANLIFDEQYSLDFLKKSIEYIAHELFYKFYVQKEVPPNPRYLYCCYFERLERRLKCVQDVIRSDPLKWTRLNAAISDGVYINDSYFPPISAYLNYLKNDIILQKQIMICHCYDTHHDLTPENIMVDVKGGINRISAFRLIDPRSEIETGLDNRHFMYDMGKMLFGLDFYSLYRKAVKEQISAEFIYEICGANRYTLLFHHKSSLVQRLMYCQHLWIELLKKIAGTDWDIRCKQYFFAFAFMYHPSLPWSMIMEKDEKKCLLLYLRGMWIFRYCMSILYGHDPLSDKPGQTELWPMG